MSLASIRLRTKCISSIALLSNVDSAGLYYRSLRFGNIQILTSDRGFHFAKLDGAVLSSHFQESPIRFGAVSREGRTLGTFGKYQGKWSYEIVKIGQQMKAIWTRTLKASSSNSNPSPRCLVIAGGGCAFVEGLNFVVLNPDGTESFSIPVRGKKITSQPYLSEAGQFYIGLSNDIDDFLRISFKP